MAVGKGSATRALPFKINERVRAQNQGALFEFTIWVQKKEIVSLLFQMRFGNMKWGECVGGTMENDIHLRANGYNRIKARTRPRPPKASERVQFELFGSPATYTHIIESIKGK
ncbi:unnamed protein product [Sphenostylis stenocarpa]|uniref:Uncharacterized protein n=1 Tax=Sphenostylis stenocarpa TaxID=92480 RepID=A0AA86VXY2_9FABA|nr:unnamed protein product [Sphenostylis stenocarpa]